MFSWKQNIKLSLRKVFNPLFVKRIKSLYFTLEHKKSNQTIDYIINYTGWPEKDVVVIVKYMVKEGLLEEELDMESGLWFYYVPDKNISDKDYLDVEERFKLLEKK